MLLLCFLCCSPTWEKGHLISASITRFTICEHMWHQYLAAIVSSIFSPPFFPHHHHYLWLCHDQKFKFKKKKINIVIQWIIDINHPQHKTLIVKHSFTGKESNSLQVFHRSKSSSTFSTTTPKNWSETSLCYSCFVVGEECLIWFLVWFVDERC